MIEIVNIIDWKDKQGIYLIKNVLNNKAYVGGSIFATDGIRTTRSIHIRLREHLYDLNKGKHANRHLQAAWNKYGTNNFKMYILELVDGDVLVAEQRWIKELQVCNPEFGYNICLVAGSPFAGRTHTEETKEKLRMLSTGRKHSEESRKKMSQWQIGKVLSEETKHKISMSEKGKVIPNELRQRWSKARKGIPKSETFKKIMSMSARTRKLNKEDVLTIRKRLAAGQLASVLASEYNVTIQNIAAIQARRTWKYI
jgi:group I intron endonuclease